MRSLVARLGVLGLTVTIAGAGGAPRAVAQDAAAADGPEEEALTRARPLFERGIELVTEQRWSDALDAFHRAHALFPSAIILFNVGFCQRALGQYVAARETFRAFLAQDLSGIAASRREEAEGYLRELDGRVARLEVAIPPELRAGLELFIDGRTHPVTSRVSTVDVDPGRHTVHARREGYSPLFVDRDLGPGERAAIHVALTRLPARLAVTSNVDGAVVTLNDEPAGSIPFDDDVAPGRHLLSVSAEGFITHRSELNLAPGGAARVRADLEIAPVPLTARWWFWTAVGAVVAGAAAVTYLLVRPDPEPPPYDDGNLDWLVTVP